MTDRNLLIRLVGVKFANGNHEGTSDPYRRYSEHYTKVKYALVSEVDLTYLNIDDESLKAVIINRNVSERQEYLITPSLSMTAANVVPDDKRRVILVPLEVITFDFGEYRANKIVSWSLQALGNFIKTWPDAQITWPILASFISDNAGNKVKLFSLSNVTTIFERRIRTLHEFADVLVTVSRMTGTRMLSLNEITSVRAGGLRIESALLFPYFRDITSANDQPSRTREDKNSSRDENDKNS